VLTVPVGDVLVGDAGGDVEHDDAALAIDVVAVSQPSKFLLACRVPDVELDLAEVLLRIRSSCRLMRSRVTTYGCETQGMNFYPQSGDIFLLEFSCKMSLDERRLQK
jgi:hypothetical protein